MEEEFYATIKLKHSGEEVFSKVLVNDDHDETKLFLTTPIIIEQVKIRGRVGGYKMEPWLKTTTNEVFVVDLNDVLTMSESDDLEMILYYEDYVTKMHKTNYADLNRKMGYLGTVEDTKKSLEKLFNKS